MWNSDWFRFVLIRLKMVVVFGVNCLMWIFLLMNMVVILFDVMMLWRLLFVFVVFLIFVCILVLVVVNFLLIDCSFFLLFLSFLFVECNFLLIVCSFLFDVFSFLIDVLYCLMIVVSCLWLCCSFCLSCVSIGFCLFVLVWFFLVMWLVILLNMMRRNFVFVILLWNGWIVMLIYDMCVLCVYLIWCVFMFVFVCSVWKIVVCKLSCRFGSISVMMLLDSLLLICLRNWLVLFDRWMMFDFLLMMMFGGEYVLSVCWCSFV